MKKLVRKSLILGLLVGSMALMGCGGGNGGSNAGGSSKPSGSSKSGQTQYEVKFVSADGAEISKENVNRGTALDKPADPAAPTGKRFFGWQNVKNGGQIWDFENEDINIVLKDVELKPLFVDASLQDQYLEAELCPDIVEFDYVKNEDGSYKLDDDGNKIPVPMEGATYSGGQRGKGLIYRAFDGEFDAHGAYIREDIAEKIQAVDEEGNPKVDGQGNPVYEIEQEQVVDDQGNPVLDGEGNPTYQDKLDEEGNPVYKTKTTKGVARYAKEGDPAGDVFAGFVHFMYENGDRLTWEIESDVAAENVTLFMRLSGEYGLENAFDDKVSFSFDDEMFKVKVNGEDLKYGEVTIANVEPKTLITFQDYFVSANVSLRQGKNTIQMLVDNEQTLNGTIASTAPCVDCIKLLSSSNITWEDARISNLSK